MIKENYKSEVNLKSKTNLKSTGKRIKKHEGSKATAYINLLKGSPVSIKGRKNKEKIESPDADKA